MCLVFSYMGSTREVSQIVRLQPDRLYLRSALRKKEQEAQCALDNVCGLVCFVALGSRCGFHIRRVHQRSAGSGGRDRSDQVLSSPEDRLLMAKATYEINL